MKYKFNNQKIYNKDTKYYQKQNVSDRFQQKFTTTENCTE